MTLAEAMALIVPPINDLKRRSARRVDGEDVMFSTLVALREDRVVAAVSTPRMQATLACAHTVAVGMAPQLLAVAAQISLPEGTAGIAYTTMNSDHQAAFAVQPYTGTGQDLTFGIPERANPSDRGIMDRLAAAMNLSPLDAAQVSAGPNGQDASSREAISPERGRLVIDASTCSALHRSVQGIGGTVLFIAANSEHADALLAHGMPQDVLLGAGTPA